MELICNRSKAKELPGWEPRIPPDEGLAGTIDFIRANLHRYKSQIYHL